MKIKIGADELILWIRKNELAKVITNDEIHALGVIIYRIVEGFGDRKIEDNLHAIGRFLRVTLQLINTNSHKLQLSTK